MVTIPVWSLVAMIFGCAFGLIAIVTNYVRSDHLVNNNREMREINSKLIDFIEKRDKQIDTLSEKVSYLEYIAAQQPRAVDGAKSAPKKVSSKRVSRAVTRRH